MASTPVGIFDFSPEAIRARREKCGLSREGLAILVSRSAATVRSWEQGERTPSATARPALLAALGLSRPISEFVARTTTASGVPERIEDPAVAEQIAEVLR
jgi:transcriptional regulator with XRE-family HTH domain